MYADLFQENGVANAIQAIYRDLEYAKTLARQRSMVSSTPFTPAESKEPTVEQPVEDDLADIEETWTFVGDETDIDISKRVREREEAEADLSAGLHDTEATVVGSRDTVRETRV